MRNPRTSLQGIGRRNWTPPARSIEPGQWNGFEPYLEELVDKGVGAKVTIPKDEVGELPPKFRPSPPPRSLQNQAQGVYREDRDVNHFQARDFGTYWEIELDKFHPDYYPLEHLANVPIAKLEGLLKSLLAKT